MPEISRPVQRSSKVRWFVAAGSLLALLLLIILMSWLRPGVPKTVEILAGPAGSRSHEAAGSYAEYAGSHGVEATVLETAGSGEILERLIESETPVIGFFQSGAERESAAGPGLKSVQSLGSLYFEPLWLFARSDLEVRDLGQIIKMRVFIGPPGSDARAASRAILTALQVSPAELDPELAQLSSAEAAEALLAGEIDAAAFAGEFSHELVGRLLASESVRPLSARHAEVYSRIQPDVGNLLIPQGLFDLVRMLPREDVRVIAPAINLIAKEDVHPALVDLFLAAATSVHGGATLLSKRGEFPSEDYTSLPMNEDAIRYYKAGPSGFRKYLPFWLASLFDQLMIYLVPLFVVLSSVFKGIPVLIGLKVRIALQRYYLRLQQIEKAPDLEQHLAKYLAELDAIDADSAKLRVPRMYVRDYFDLRQFIHDMRERLTRDPA